MNSGSSRAPAPPPLQMPSRAVTSPLSPTPKSADSKQARYSSDDYADMMASPSSRRGRQGSGSSQGSKYVNANSYCGRHSSQYLFGGHSIGELWRNITKKE